ncbi:MAG: carbohydrate ABC transporter permease [Anaerolineae bacterium]
MNNAKSLLVKILVWTGVLFFLFWTVFPILWALSVSLKSGSELFLWPPRYIPLEPTFEHYRAAFTRDDFLAAIRNSLIIMVVATPISVLLSALGAYGLARYQFPGKEFSKYGILSIRMIPGILIAIPMFIIARKLGMHDRIITLIIAYVAFNLPFTIWMLTGFFEEIPREIEESALIDGCSPWQVFIRIVLPLSAPALVAATIFCMILCWNEFQFAVILTFTQKSKTLPIIIAGFYTDRGILFGQMAATGMVAMLPVLAFGVYVQKYLVRGLTAGAVKG